tara:strand:+ start:65 stop:457 length:393 start_codon:yes stop_codon:yes gene_type:complete
MERIIYVDIEPQKPFLTQYTRRLLLDCVKGVKELQENQYIDLHDIFTTITKLNTTDATIRLYFTIIPFDDSFPKNTMLSKYNTNDIESLNQKISQLEELLLEHHLDLEVPWNHLSFLQVGQELHNKGIYE